MDNTLAILRAVRESRSNTLVAQRMRQAFGVYPLTVAEPRRKRRRKAETDHRETERLMANRWSATDRHGKHARH